MVPIARRGRAGCVLIPMRRIAEAVGRAVADGRSHGMLASLDLTMQRVGLGKGRTRQRDFDVGLGVAMMSGEKAKTNASADEGGTVS